MKGLRGRHKLTGATTSLAGTVLIFALVIGLNEFAARNNYDDRERQTAFDVSTPPDQPEPVAEPEPEPQSEPENPEPPPPLAELDSGIGSVDIPIPGLDASELNALDASDGGDLVMTDDTVDDPPQPTRQARMEYPPGAKRDGVEGYVTLSLLIDDRGEVQQVRILESEPAGVFDETAREALRQWQFRPARYQGEPVRVWARQTIRFDLN